MLHAKFQDHRTSCSGEEEFPRFSAKYRCGGHLGHATHSACQESIFDQRRSDVANFEDKVYG